MENINHFKKAKKIVKKYFDMDINFNYSYLTEIAKLESKVVL